jgi:hypothetical protein
LWVDVVALYDRIYRFADDQIRKFCNSEIVLPDSRDPGISEGFIHNPGYPRFYSSERECRWKIRAPQEQRIRITVLDISVTGKRQNQYRSRLCLKLSRIPI